MKKKILAMILSVTMIFGMLPLSALTAFAVSTQRTEALDLTSQETADSLDTEGWAWNAETKTLTLDGLDLSVSSGHAVTVPDGTKIVLAPGSANTIKATESKKNGIYVAGNLTIESDIDNPGTLNIAAPHRGIFSEIINTNSGTEKNHIVTISNLILNIEANRGVMLDYYPNSNATSVDTVHQTLTMTDVIYNFTGIGSSGIRMLQIWTDKGNATLALNDTIAQIFNDVRGSVVINASKEAALTVIDSTLTAGSLAGKGTSINIGNQKAEIAKATIINSSITAIDEDSAAFLLYCRDGGEQSFTATNSNFFVAYLTDITNIPAEGGNSMTAVKFGSATTEPTIEGNTVTVKIPADTAITSGGTTYTVTAETEGFAYNMTENSLEVPANTALKTADGSTIVSEGALTFETGADPVMSANTKTTITTSDGITVALTPTTDDAIVRTDSEGNIEVPAGTSVKIGDNEVVSMPNGGVVTASGESIKSNTVSISSDANETTVDGTISVSVNIGGENTFNAAELEFTYPNDLLEYDGSASVLSGAGVEINNGVLKLLDYGDEEALRNGVYTLVFKAIKSGTASISLISAAVGTAESAVTMDLVKAYCENSEVAVIIKNNVTLDGIFSGTDSVADGGDYTFKIEDATGDQYNYGTPTATVDGVAAEVVDNGDGTWTVKNVTGALVITGTRAPKGYGVTVNGDTAATDGTSAEYGTDYSFTLADDLAAGTLPGYYYTFNVTIGGVKYTGYTASGRVYTIPGADITGDVVITVTKNTVEPNKFNIGIIGNGIADATLSANVVDKNGNVTLTLTPEAGYAYTVTAGAYEVVRNGNAYTVSNVTSAVEFSVVKSLDISRLEVSEYVSVNGGKVWLIKLVGKIDEKIYTYNGESMFWSDKYNAYVTLALSSTKPAPTADDFAIVAGSAVSVANDEKDINMSGTVDANDAQLIWNIYNAQYSGFTETVTAEKYLRADVDGNGVVNMLDAAAIADHILTA